MRKREGERREEKDRDERKIRNICYFKYFEMYYKMYYKNLET